MIKIFENNDIMNLGCQIDPGNNFDLVPNFVDPSNYSYQLLPNSQLIDLGVTPVNPMANTDLDFNYRIMGNNIDLGAYEFIGSSQRKAKPADSLFSETSKIRIYPNPATDIIQVVTDNQIVKLLIFDSFGNILIKKETQFQKYSEHLNISKLTKGIYLIKVVTENKTFNKTIIKL